MNICLIGDGLTSLTLAKALVNNNIKVFMYSKNKRKFTNYNRTIGITSDNLEFFQKEIIKIKKSFLWQINRIKIYNEKNKKEKIFDFEREDNSLFSIIKNKDLFNLLICSLKKNKNFEQIIIKNNFFYEKIIKNKNYDLIINFDPNNKISKRYFYKKITKNYDSKAYVTTIDHKKIKNDEAIQIFTKYGPIAFLPTSNNQTSIVFSIKNKFVYSNSDISQLKLENLIFKNNNKYEIKSIKNFESLKLKSKTLRNYSNKNILAFGEMLHQIHPLSGQGFNMTIRDIKTFLNLLKDRESIGLPIDLSLCIDFENRTKHLNYIYSSGNDFIYEFFNYDNFYLKIFPKKIFNLLNNNIFFKKIAINYADKGIMV